MGLYNKIIIAILTITKSLFLSILFSLNQSKYSTFEANLIIFGGNKLFI